MILGIDPGTYESAYVVWDEKKEKILEMDICTNIYFLETLYPSKRPKFVNNCVIECMQYQGSRGVKNFSGVGKHTFKTCEWIGTFKHAWGIDDVASLYRSDVIIHLCGSMRGSRHAKKETADTRVRRALINRFGEPGEKGKEGKLYGVKSHIWSALAVAVTYGDRIKK